MSGAPVRRDHLAGGLVALIGATAVVLGRRYGMGTPTHIGPGLFPLALGVVLLAVGAGIMVLAGDPGRGGTTAGAGAPEGSEHRTLPPLGWRAPLCILGGPVLFILLADRLGLAPAAFACVLLASRATPETTLPQSLLLAGTVTLFGVLLFHSLLGVSLPLFALPSSAGGG